VKLTAILFWLTLIIVVGTSFLFIVLGVAGR
jgi:hypothetical protein